MDSFSQKKYESARFLENKAFRSACYAPFVSLYFTTYGGVLACCKNGSFTLGNLQQERLRDIWEGKKIKELRQALMEYRFDLGCGYCEWEINGQNYQTATPLLFDELPVASTAPLWPLQIEFEGSTICNFECVMCNGSTSSSIRINRDGLPALPVMYGDEFFHDLRPFLPHLKRARFFGGEPFLARESYRVWDLMVEDRLSTECHVTTNGSVFNKKVEEVLEALPFHIAVSIDGATKETVEKIRVNCRFEQLIENIHRFQEYTKRKSTSFHFAFCLMRQNWHEFGDLLLFAEERGVEVWVNTVIDPSFCSLYTLPRNELARVTDQLCKQAEGFKRRLHLNRRSLEETLLKLRMAASESQTKEFLQVLDRYYDADDDPLLKAAKKSKSGGHSEALALARTVPANDFNYYSALTMRGYTQGILGDLKTAEEDLNEALKLSHKRPEAYLNIARIRLKQNRIEEARKNAVQASKLVTPEDRLQYEIAELLAMVYLRQVKFLQAHHALKPIAKLRADKSPMLGLIYPASGIRKELPLETEANPRRAKALVCRWMVSALLEMTTIVLKVRLTKLFAALLWHGESIRREADLKLDQLRKSKWWLRVAGDNLADLAFPNDNPHEVRINIKRAGTNVTYDIQLNYTGVRVRSDHSYSLDFRARADNPRNVFIGCANGQAPWRNLGMYKEVGLTTQWQSFDVNFIATMDDDNARIHFDLGHGDIPIELSLLSFRRVSGQPIDSQSPQDPGQVTSNCG